MYNFTNHLQRRPESLPLSQGNVAMFGVTGREHLSLRCTSLLLLLLEPFRSVG